MRSSNIPLTLAFLFVFSVQFMETLPLHHTEALTSPDVDVLMLLLQRLEESRPASARDQEQVNVDQTLLQPETQRDVREYLSARDLKTVRQDSKRYSGCFGSRLDRIGSMSSLGCNTARRTNRS
ncbi:natriuretic peptides B [Triplophysa dalaica]|uniref:natriuretic peptides B n=1 Tax=Triplophysa dalaica TaxID=1582913 RepID=UPI0024DF4BA1|nr:natriuretic peptides B [Triplophysa dalaica]